MGTDNRAKRAAKAKKRAKQRAQHAHTAREPQSGNVNHGAPQDPFDFEDPRAASNAPADLRSVVSRRMTKSELPSDMRQFARSSVSAQRRAVDDLLDELIVEVTRAGWTPNDLGEVTRRRLTASLSDYTLSLIAAYTAEFTADKVAPGWRTQLDGVNPARGSRSWTDETNLAWDDARNALVDLLSVLAALPRIEPLIAPPGAWEPIVSEARGVDARILSKVRRLLAKAESTDFDDEAEALTAKAQDLMRTYSIEHTLLADKKSEKRLHPEVRRVWIDAPYVDAKASLINEVASSNRCKCVLTSAYGFVSLMGFATDLDTVEVLSTSLLFQASRAMRAEGSRRYRDGGSRTRSFRQSFLVAYSQRIGERLRNASTATEARVDAAHGGALLPVLAARDEDVSAYADELFPHLTSRAVNVVDREGYGAGRAAADKANIEMRDAIEDATSAHA